MPNRVAPALANVPMPPTIEPIAIISDIHGNIEAAQAVLADIHAQGIHRILNLGDTVGYGTLERLRYGARLARQSRLPLLVTGGAPFGGRPEAEAMRETLEQDFGIKVRWVEAASRDTAENASLSAPMLKAAGITRIALVSHGWHLPRAIPLFEKQGLEVTPAPMAFSTGSPSLFEDLLPRSMTQSRRALNEYLGQIYNRLKEMK